MATVSSALSSTIPKTEDRTRSSGGLIHIFSSSYLGRLFKNPFSLANVAPFKVRPTPSHTDRYALPERPATGRACSTCFGSTVLDQWNQTSSNEPPAAVGQQEKPQRARLCDVLELPSTACKASYNFIKRIADVIYSVKLDVNRPYPRVDAAVLSGDRVQEGISKNVMRAEDDDEDTFGSVSEIDLAMPSKKEQRALRRVELLLARERVRARCTLQMMRAHISGLVLQIAGYILFKLLRIILRTVQVSPTQVDKVKKASDGNIPMIYLPNHRSHLDYILLSFTLAQFGFRTPYVAAGDNLDIPVFSWFLRSLGAFFIKRRLDKKDMVYRAVMHSYIEELLKKGESLEFFVEAGRSRTGRPILPKAGLLSVVVETYLQGHMPNAFIVPVSVSYEKLIEGSFSRELMGEPKKKETFWATVKGIWSVFCTKYGSVRIDFGQPVTIKEYLNCLRENLSHSPSSNITMAFSSVLETNQKPQQLSKSLSSRSSLLSLCSGIDLSGITDENRRLIKAMCNHIVYDFSKNAALMCTQMLAFLLTTKYRRGGRLDDIVEDFHWLCRRVMANGRDVGFSGDPRDVVRYAIELLGSDLVTSEISDIDSGMGSDSGLGGWNAIGSGARYEKEFVSESYMWLVRPNTTLPKAHELAYYAAPVGLVFLQEAAIANALLSASLDATKAASKNRGGTIHSSKILDRALALTDLLQHEFLFVRPCLSTRQSLEQTLDRMVQEGLLIKRGYSVGSSTSVGSTYGVRFCLDKNQVYGAVASPAGSSHGSTASLNTLDDDVITSAVPEKARKRKVGGEHAFYLPSEDDDLADYEDETDDEQDAHVFTRRLSNSSLSQRRGSYGIASLVESEDDYNADVIRLYASTLAPLLETYKFVFKMVLEELAKPPDTTQIKTLWRTETELIRKLMTAAKGVNRDAASFIYAEAVSVEPMRNAIRWLILKGVLIATHDRLRLHDSYVDDRDTLDQFRSEIDELCVVVTY